MISKEDMKFGLNVLILADDDNWGKRAYVEAPGDNGSYAVVIPDVQKYLYYKLQDLMKI